MSFEVPRSLCGLRKSYRQLKQDIAQHQLIHEKSVQEFQELQQRHEDTWIRFDLISRLLAIRPKESVGLERFRKLLANDYMLFAEREFSLAAEAKALSLLQSIEQELAMLVGFPDLRQRTIVGIVGGFSSGKSEFINSFIADPDVRLAVGLQPVTVIPSYVISTSERLIRGYSANGGYTALEVDTFKKISHAFVSSFDFDLRKLMPFVCIGVPLKKQCFSDICFIDTPGYNPPQTAPNNGHGDRQTAVQFARQADSIVWLISLENGTVPHQELEFIHEIGVEARSVYVVLTKADLKSKEDIDAIIEEVRDQLIDAEIKTVGICAYSSTQCEVISYREVSLYEYFASINRYSDIKQNIDRRLTEVFNMYINAIKADVKKLDAQKLAVNSLRLDALEFGGEELYDKMYNVISKLEKTLETDSLSSLLETAEKLHMDFNATVSQTISDLK